MNVNILLFATLKDIAGKRSLTLTLDKSNDAPTINTVKNKLIEQYPEIETRLNSAIASVNEEYAFNETPVNENDTVAFFPPVSGGETKKDQPEIFLLSEDPINHDEIIQSITTPATGAVCLFSGMVRGVTTKEGYLPSTQHLEYEAYNAMALQKMKQVADEIREQWQGVQGIAIIQRLGTLRVGENTVLIACSSAHRDSGCFEAARYGIDRLKEIVPVWKKEVSPDKQQWIEGEYYPSNND